jgi:hypothetical protein
VIPSPSSEPSSSQRREPPERPAGKQTPHGPRSPDPVTDAIRIRLRRVLMRYSARQVAQATRHNHETVRRYLLAGTLPAEFLYAVCVVYGVCPRYLLLGIGSAGAFGESAILLKTADADSTAIRTSSLAKVVVAHAGRDSQSQAAEG